MRDGNGDDRTKQFALRVIKVADALPNTRSANTIANQVIRSGTSVAANYRALCRAKSRQDFIDKTGLVEEEADETRFWLEVIAESELLSPKRVEALLQEADEITAMPVATRKTALQRRG